MSERYCSNCDRTCERVPVFVTPDWRSSGMVAHRHEPGELSPVPRSAAYSSYGAPEDDNPHLHIYGYVVERGVAVIGHDGNIHAHGWSIQPSGMPRTEYVP